MAVRVAINGFGRIGRNVLRAIIESGRTDIEVVAINDLGPVETNAHLFRFDSVHGRFNGTVTVDGDTINVGRGPIKVTAVRNPAELPHAAARELMERVPFYFWDEARGEVRWMCSWDTTEADVRAFADLIRSRLA